MDWRQFTNRRGRRSSAAYAFLEPLREDHRLTVELQAEVARIIIRNGVAEGVEYRTQGGASRIAYASGEILLAAGALVSPKLLMFSGVRPAEQLRRHGIDCQIDLAGVGENLIAHPEVPMIATMNGPYGYFRQGNDWRMVGNGLQFKLFGTGPVTSAGVEAGAFASPEGTSSEPAIQAFCVPIVYLDRDTRKLVDDTYGVTITTVVVKPKSRGSVTLHSADPADMPMVSPNLLLHDDDMRAMVAGQRFFRRAFETEPLASRIDRVALPAAGASDDEMRDHCRRFVKTNCHPSGTCRMGADGDPMAVLDARMRVRGVSRLRICDMSAAPNINAGNTNAPAMMLGDRCASFVLGTEQTTRS